MRTLIACMCVAFGVSAANAGVTFVDVVSSPGAVEADVVNEIFIDFDGPLGGQQLFIALDSGTVYNTAGFGGNTAPNAGFVGLVPALADDSFVTMGGDTFESSEGVLVVGGAVNIGGAPGDLNIGDPLIDASQVSVAWAPAAGVTIQDQVDFLVAQISLSSDANGVAFFFGSTTDNAPIFEIAGTVADGAITFIPEPTSAVLAALAMVGGCIRRR